jgi:hypothetical protein
MTSCDICKGKGFTSGSMILGGKEHKQYSKCQNPSCPFEHKYYDFIRNRYSTEYKDNIVEVDFKNRKVLNRNSEHGIKKDKED